MNRHGYSRLAIVAAFVALVAVVVFAPPVEAELQAEQQTNWGLETAGPSRTVATFDSLGWAAHEMGPTMFVGGKFLNVTNGDSVGSQPFLAGFSSTTGVWRSEFAPQVGGPVLALEASPDGGLFVGGEMDTWNGQEVGALIKIDPATGEIWPGWNTRLYGGTSVVRNLSLGPDGWLYAVGTFTTASDANNPQTVDSVVRLNPATGAIDWSWLPVTNGGGVWGVSRSQTTDTVYLAGWFSINGSPAVGISASDATAVTWDAFEMNFPCCGKMYDVEATEFGTVMFVGEQHGAYMYDEGQNMALMISHATNYDSRYQATTNRRGGDYQRIERVGDRLYATCHCWGSHSSTTGPAIQPLAHNMANVTGTHTGLVNGVLAYDPQTGAHVTSFAPYMSGDLGGWGVAEAADGCLWVTGGFNAIGNPGSQRAARDLVRLCDENQVQPTVPAPASCLATINGDVIAVTWEGVAEAVDYVIYRSVDGGQPSWRGRAVAAPFTDTNRDAQLVYSVAASDLDNVKSGLTECASDVVVDPPVQVEAPASCTAIPSGNSVAVTWPASPDAIEYIVYRTVDGGPQYWRGRTADLNFADSGRDGVLVYYVSAKNAALERSDRTECTTGEPVDPEPIVITPVASCTVTRPVPTEPNVVVTWEPSPDAGAEYVVYRSVDGGTQFWRGRVAGSTFDDVLRPGEHAYFVDVKVGNERSVRVACTPTITEGAQ